MTQINMPNAKQAVAFDTLPTGFQIWTSVRDGLRDRVSDAAFGKWISDLSFIAEVDGVMRLIAQSGLQRDRVNTEFLRLINRVWSDHDPKHRRVAVSCWSDLPEDVQSLAETWQNETVETSPEEPQEEPATSVRSTSAQHTFDNLVVGESNRVAATVARKIAASNGAPAASVYLYGRHGVGKSHILHAIQHEMLANADDRSVVYMSAEEFMVAFVEGVKRKDTSELKARLRNSDVLLIDDLQAITGMAGTQKEFFSNIRAVVARGGQVVITADEAPSELTSLNVRVREELQGGACIKIEDPDESMRRRIVETKVEMLAADNPEFSLDEACVDLIVSRVRGPGRQLYGAVCNVFTATTFVGREVTFEDVSAAVRRQVGDAKAPTIDQVKRATCQAFGVTKTDLESARRTRTIVYPRQMAMFVCRKLTTRSLPQIGKYFGDRDHTTVLYAIRKIEERLSDDATLRSDVAKLERAVEDIQSGGN